MGIRKIIEFFRKRESLISGVLAVLILFGWVAFVLGFIFAHGVCCFDDAGMAVRAKDLANGNLGSLLSSTKTYLAVILPVSLGIQWVGNTYWIPGLSVLALDVLFLLLILLLLRKYEKKLGYVIATLTFTLLNYALMGKHFEQWYAALGEIPAGLSLLTGILLYFHWDSWINQTLAGLLFSLAFLTKLVSFIALFSMFISIFIMALISLVKGQKRKAASNILGAVFLTAGFGLPILAFEGIRYFSLGEKLQLNLLVRSMRYIPDFTILQEPVQFLAKYQEGSSVFSERFGVPWLSVLLMMAAVGVMIREDETLKRIYYVILAIFVFWSLWWFFYSIHWARHFISLLVLIIFAIALPFLGSLPRKWLLGYGVVVVLWTSFAWKQLSIPIEQLQGRYYRPTKKTKALLEISDVLSKQADDELVVTQSNYTIKNFQYMMDDQLRVTHFREDREYKPPFWIAVDTKFMDYQDQSFQRFLQGCSGLREYDGYLVGRCE